MKKLAALVMVGVMTLGMTCMAAESPSASAVVASASSEVSTSVASAAAKNNMTVAEYINNTVTEVPGLEDTMVTGQGGHVVINGAPSNYTITMVKPTKAEVKLATDQAAAVKGKILSYFGIKSCSFKTAKVNFWLKGLKGTQKVSVYQYVNGAWVKVAVNEIREDHVVVTLENNTGKLLFVEN